MKDLSKNYPLAEIYNDFEAFKPKKSLDNLNQIENNTVNVNINNVT